MRLTKTIIGLGGVAAVGLILSGCSTVGRYVPQRGCTDMTVSIYFDRASAEVTDPGRQVIRMSADAMKACKVHEVHLVGLSDSTGQAQANLDLSKQRAGAVLEAYQAAGLAVTRYHMVAAGSKNAVNAEGELEPLRRRVEATLVTGREPKVGRR